MPSVFENLNINSVILHEIYERDLDRNLVNPKLSDVCTELDAAGKSNLEARIIKAIGSSSSGVQMEIAKTSVESCFQLAARAIKADKDAFVAISKNVPQMLAEAQTSRRLPGGIVVVIKATVGASSKDCLIIIKAEQQTGFASEEDENEHSIKMRFLDNLLLTPQQKLYKIGVFVEEHAAELVDGLRDKGDFTAFVYDHNMTLKDERQAASYFYDSFLGLSIPEDSKILTRNFYEFTKAYINDADLTDEEKVDLNTALYVYLKNDQSNVVESATFAETYVPEGNRDGYLEYLESKGFPDHAVSKDVALLSGKLRQRRITFSSNVKILAPADEFSESVKIIDSENGDTLLRIKGTIRDQE